MEDFSRPRSPRGTLLIEKTDLAQHRVFRRGVRRSVDNSHFVSEFVSDLDHHTRIGRNPGSLLERQIKAIKKNFGHRIRCDASLNHQSEDSDEAVPWTRVLLVCCDAAIFSWTAPERLSSLRGNRGCA